jgi:hypothetical protein
MNDLLAELRAEVESLRAAMAKVSQLVSFADQDTYEGVVGAVSIYDLRDALRGVKRSPPPASPIAAVVGALRDAAVELDEAGDRHAAQVLRRLANQREATK